MITNKGVELLGRYVVGHIPTFASHIAIGCGENTLLNSESLADYSARTSLTFETIRVPITSRTLSVENGTQEVVFTAELPAEERYAITEVGIYPSERSNAPGTENSRILYGFQQSENWLFHDLGAETISEVPIKQSRLDSTLDGDIDVSEQAFQTYPDNGTFLFEDRLSRQEQPRFLSNVVVLRGDTSLLDNTTSLPATPQNHLHLTGVDLSFLDRANPANDEIRLAFSVISKDLLGADPSRVQVVVEFTNDEVDDPTTYARLIVNRTSNLSNRYIVVSSKLSDLSKSSDFNWSLVSTIKIYVDVDNSSSYYVALDAMSFENLGSIDSQYGLAGYTVFKNESSDYPGVAVPVIKYDNEISLLEFRFELGVEVPAEAP